MSDRAQTVVDALVGRCRALGVELRTGCRAGAIEQSGEGQPRDFAITIAHAPDGAVTTLRAARVIVATGGRSLPRTGSDGAGYALVRALGHTVTETHPALVPLVLRGGFFHAALRGIAHPAELSTLANGRRADRRTGSLLWTHFGISGPVVLDASRHWVLARARGDEVELRMSVFPGETAEQVDARLRTLAAERPRASLGRLLAAHLPERLADALLHTAGVDPATPSAQLARDARRRLVHVLTELSLPVEGSRGWDHAEVTAGGVPLAEVDYRTMASRKAAGLYLAGEILDCEGRIGGFNFQWAWATGYLAGRAAVRSLDAAPAAPA